MSVNKTSFTWFCPSCTADPSAQNFKIEAEIQSIHEKIEEEAIGNLGFSVSNLNPSDVFLESESSSGQPKARSQFELPFPGKENQIRNVKSELEDFFSQDNGSVNPHNNYFS